MIKVLNLRYDFKKNQLIYEFVENYKRAVNI